MNYLDFKNKWLGKRIDIDGAFGFQCVDLARQYVQEVYGEKSYPFWHNGSLELGGAIDAFYDFNHSLIRSQKATLITNDPNDANQYPVQGDIVIFAGNRANPYGHIAIVDAPKASPHKFLVLEQNGDGTGSGVGGGAIRVYERPYIGVLGWIHFNFEYEDMGQIQDLTKAVSDRDAAIASLTNDVNSLKDQVNKQVELNNGWQTQVTQARADADARVAAIQEQLNELQKKYDSSEQTIEDLRKQIEAIPEPENVDIIKKALAEEMMKNDELAKENANLLDQLNGKPPPVYTPTQMLIAGMKGVLPDLIEKIKDIFKRWKK